jgi:peptide/nickel transport system permease protein
MLLYIARRVLFALPTALAVGTVCFMLVQIAPGDTVNALVPADAPADLVAQIKKDYGLDKPLPVQLFIWLSHVATGDLGRSLATGRPVWRDLSQALGYTITLAVVAAAVAFVVGTVLGGLAASFRGSVLDRAAMGLAITGVSIPHYWLGMLLVVIFSVELNLLPAIGAGPSASEKWAWDWAHLQYLVLPAATMCAIPAGIVARTVRGTVIELLNQEFVTALKAKGLGQWRITLHVFKNAAASVLAVMGLQLGYLMGGSILVETVFSWPGTGFLLNSAIFQRDIPVLQGTILVLALIFVTLNLIVDIAQSLIDPRIKRQ